MPCKCPSNVKKLVNCVPKLTVKKDEKSRKCAGRRWIFLKIRLLKLAYFWYILTLFLSKSAGTKTYFGPLTLKSEGAMAPYPLFLHHCCWHSLACWQGFCYFKYTSISCIVHTHLNQPSISRELELQIPFIYLPRLLLHYLS